MNADLLGRWENFSCYGYKYNVDNMIHQFHEIETPFSYENFTKFGFNVKNIIIFYYSATLDEQGKAIRFINIIDK